MNHMLHMHLPIENMLLKQTCVYRFDGEHVPVKIRFSSLAYRKYLKLRRLFSVNLHCNPSESIDRFEKSMNFFLVKFKGKQS